MSFDATRADKAALKNVATFLLGVIPTFQRRRQENPGYAASPSQWYITTVPEIPERLLRCRRVAIEPKVPLANERTLLAWLEWATFLAGASVAFATYSDFQNDPLTQIIGLLTLPFSISVIIYALYECELPCHPYMIYSSLCTYIYMSLLVDWVALMHLLHFFFNRKCSSSPSFAYQIRCDLNLSREGIRQTNSPIRKALWSFLLYSFAFSSPLLLLNSSNIKRRVTLTLPLHATFWKDFHFTFLK